MRIGRLAEAVVIVTLALLVGPLTFAHADSGGATINTLPESEALQVHAEVHHQCSLVNEYEACDWFPEASAYSASAGCPYVYDGSHGVWVGEVETSEGSSSGNFAFSPYGLEREVVVCLYINAGSEDSLVGESHPFDRLTGREVVYHPPPPPPPPPKGATRTSVSVSVRGCAYWPHIRANGQKSIGGHIAITLYRLHNRRWLRLWTETEAIAGDFGEGAESPGTYKLAARFLGDKNLYASPSAGSATFKLLC